MALGAADGYIRQKWIKKKRKFSSPLSRSLALVVKLIRLESCCHTNDPLFFFFYYTTRLYTNYYSSKIKKIFVFFSLSKINKNSSSFIYTYINQREALYSPPPLYSPFTFCISGRGECAKRVCLYPVRCACVIRLKLLIRLINSNTREREREASPAK